MKRNISIKWFPPSWVQIKSRSHTIYIDPAYLKSNFSSYAKTIEYSKWPDPIDGLPEELEKADIVLITHHHKDHCKKVTVDRLKNEQTKIFAPSQCSKELGNNITIVKPGIEIELGDIAIRTIEAYNEEKDGDAKLMHRKGVGVGYVIIIDGKTIYHAGDTDFVPEIGHLKNIDVALLPIGGRGFTMDIDEAVKAAKKINPKVVIPMHRFESSAEEYKSILERTTLIKVEPLDIGESYKM